MSPLLSSVPLTLLAITMGAVCVSVIKETIRTQRSVVRTTRALPHVSILILIDASVITTRQCLESILRTRYSKVDIVLVYDPVSKDSVAYSHMVRGLSSPNVYFYRRRTTADKTTMLREAYKRSRKGDVIITMTSDMMLQPDTLKRIARKARDLTGRPCLFAVDDSTEDGIAEVALSLRSAAGRLLATLLPRKPIGSRDLGIGYAMSAEDFTSRKNVRVVPQHDYSVILRHSRTAPTVQSLIRNVEWVDLVTVLLTGVILAAMVHAVIVADGLELFTYSWISVSSALVVIVGLDKVLPVRAKINVVLCALFLPLLTPFVRLLSSRAGR